jgi:hypothetical protein
LKSNDNGTGSNYYPDFSTSDNPYTNLLYTTGSDTNDLPDISVLTNYLPGALHDELLLAAEAAVVGWETITNSQNETVGRVAYVVANCSGFLDANRLMQTNRSNGMSTGEIQPLEGSEYDFPDVADSNVTSASNFFSTVRSKWQTLVNQSEVASAYHAFDDTKSMPDYLFPFSYAPADTNTIPVVLDQTDDGIYYYIDSDGNSASVTLTGASNGQPDWVDAYAAGTDIDGTILPELIRTNLAVMISESGAHDNIGISSAAAALNSTNLWASSHLMSDMLARYNIGSEVIGAGTAADGITWYRWNEWGGDTAVNKTFFSRVFPVSVAAPFLSEISGEVVESEDESGDKSYEATFDFEFVNLFNEPIDLGDYQLRWDVTGMDGGTYEWTSSEVEESLDSGPTDFGNTGVVAPTFVEANDNRATMEPGAVLQMTCVLTSDSLDYNTNLRLFQIGSSSGVSTLMYTRCDGLGADSLWYLNRKGAMRSFKLSAYDPRVFQSGILDDTGRYFGQFYEEGSTDDFVDMASISDEFPSDDAIAALGDAASTPDGTFQMYYPESVDTDYPVFDSLAHIGHQVLRQDVAFSTIPLVGTNAADVATYFSLTNAWPDTTGRININSPYPGVLAAGFKSAEVLRTNTVSQITTNLLSQAEALELAELIIEKRAIQPNGCFTNVVQAWRSATRDEFATALGDLDKFQVEEIVARSMRLFTVRQQLFTIYVTAQSLVKDQVVGEARAVAVIWRDPVEDEDGGHDVKVLSFSYLND